MTAPIQGLLDNNFPKALAGEVMQFLPSDQDRTVVHAATCLLFCEGALSEEQASRLRNVDRGHPLVRNGRIRGSKFTYPYLLRMGRFFLKNHPAICEHPTHCVPLKEPDGRGLVTSFFHRVRMTDYLRSHRDQSESSEQCSERIAKSFDPLIASPAHAMYAIVNLCKNLLQIRNKAGEISQEDYKKVAESGGTCVMTYALLGAFTETREKLPQPETFSQENLLNLDQATLYTTTAALLIGDQIRLEYQQNPNAGIRALLDPLFTGSIEESALYQGALFNCPEHNALKDHLSPENLRNLLLRLLPVMFANLGSEQEQENLLRQYLDWTLQSKEERSLGFAYTVETLTQRDTELAEELLPQCFQAFNEGATLPEELHLLEVYSRLLLAQQDFSQYSPPLPWLKSDKFSDQLILECARTDHLEGVKALLAQTRAGTSYIAYRTVERALLTAGVRKNRELVGELIKAIDPSELLYSEANSISATPFYQVLIKKYFWVLKKQMFHLEMSVKNLPACQGAEAERIEKVLNLLKKGKETKLRTSHQLVQILAEIQENIQELPNLPELNIPQCSISSNLVPGINELLEWDREDKRLLSQFSELFGLKALCLFSQHIRRSPLLEKSPALQRRANEMAEKLAPLLASFRAGESGDSPFKEIPPLAAPTSRLDRIRVLWDRVYDLQVVRNATTFAKVWVRCVPLSAKILWHALAHMDGWAAPALVMFVIAGFVCCLALSVLLSGVYLLLAPSLLSYYEFEDVKWKGKRANEVGQLPWPCCK